MGGGGRGGGGGCHFLLYSSIAFNMCGKERKFSLLPGFDNYPKFSICDHVRVPRFCVCDVTYVGKYQKEYIRRHNFYILIFLTIFPMLVLI